MPRLKASSRLPSGSGPCVTTNGHVISGAGSPDQQFVTCLRDFGLDHVQQCADPSRSGWRTNWVIMNGTISSDAVLMGDANVDDDGSKQHAVTAVSLSE